MWAWMGCGKWEVGNEYTPNSWKKNLASILITIIDNHFLPKWECL